jgi:hypothetical protein
MPACNALAAGDCDWSVNALAVLVIAGSGRGAGKTAVGCALMAALPELNWLAVKVTPHLHGVDGGLWEERDGESSTDTGRYLRAGAAHAFLISNVSDEGVPELLMRARNGCAEASALLVESNRVDPGMVVDRRERAVCLAVLSGPVAGWKASLRDRMDDADALVLTGGLSLEELPAAVGEKAVFRLAEGQWLSPELLAFVRERIAD